MQRVFVTDGSYPNGLAAVRALGSAGFRVTVGERSGIPALARVASWSRYCSERFTYPDPRADPDAAARELARHFAARSYVAAIPVGLDSTELFVERRDALGVPSMLPPLESFRIASDKRRTFAHAAAAGIPIPRTAAAGDWERLEPPLVVKHRRTGAFVAATRDDVHAWASRCNGHADQYLVQEYVPGCNGYGYFGLFDDGREVAHFMHERLVQLPREGGPSVVARSIHDARLRRLGKQLLESLRWHGAAMVEFKRDERSGELYLIEINPKLWGSLDLAIASGCNFPVWIARTLAGEALPAGTRYPNGVTYQWTIPNGVKTFLRYPEFRSQFLRNLIDPRVRKDLRIGDPLPAVAGFVTMALNGAAR